MSQKIPLDQSTIKRVAPLCPQCGVPLMYIRATDFIGWVCMITPCCVFKLPSIDHPARKPSLPSIPSIP